MQVRDLENKDEGSLNRVSLMTLHTSKVGAAERTLTFWPILLYAPRTVSILFP
jgi:hypothetical protein